MKLNKILSANINFQLTLIDLCSNTLFSPRVLQGKRGEGEILKH